MKVKIVSDGTPQGTKVIDIKTGEMLENVTRIFWSVDIHSVARAHIEIGISNAEVIGEQGTIKYIRGDSKMRVQMYKGTAYNPVDEVGRELAKKDVKIAELEEALADGKSKKKGSKKDEKKSEEKVESEKASPTNLGTPLTGEGTSGKSGRLLK